MISPETIAIVGVAALIIFGPKKLPELGKSLGQGIREFKRGTDGLKSEFEQGLHPDAQAAQNQVVTQTPAAQQTITAQAVPVAQMMAQPQAQPQVIQAAPVQTIPVVTAAPQAEHVTEPLKS